MRGWQSLHFAGLLLAGSMVVSPACLAQVDVKYPIYFYDLAKIQVTGLALQQDSGNSLKGTSLEHGCYREVHPAYGRGPFLVSLSDAFLQRYRQRGFTLKSLCLAMATPMTMHPETGKPIPHLMYADLDAIRRKPDEGDYHVSGAVPLVIPDCFKNATPYTDCRFHFDPVSAEKNSPAQTAFLTKLGQAFDADIAEWIRDDRLCQTEQFGIANGIAICGSQGAIKAPVRDARGYLAQRVWGLHSNAEHWPKSSRIRTLFAEKSAVERAEFDKAFNDPKAPRRAHTLFPNSTMTWISGFDVGPDLAKGFGYSILANVNGLPGPSVSVNVLRRVLNSGTQGSQVNLGRLRAMLEER